MKTGKVYIVTILLLLGAQGLLPAQVNDARLWLTGGVEKKINAKIYLQAKASLRINENYSEIGSYYGDGGVGYKIMKRLRIEAHYRFSTKSRDDGSFHKRHRYYADLIYKVKTKTPFTGTARIRYQKQYSDVYSSETGFHPANTLRAEGIIGYKYKKYEPFFCTEIYYLMDNSGKYFNRIRYKLGTDYDIDKRNSITIFYMIQQELNSENPVRAFILGLGYKYIL
jgi:hypothetical protein